MCGDVMTRRSIARREVDVKFFLAEWWKREFRGCESAGMAVWARGSAAGMQRGRKEAGLKGDRRGVDLRLQR